jgi:ribose transport system ATP-binding protein
MSAQQPILSLRGVSKRFGGVQALKNADIDIVPGRIHAVLGENGAGKSTLIKIMSGVVTPDEGTIVLDGSPIQFSSPSSANEQGIVCVFQELSLVPDLTVADNIVTSNPPQRFGLIDRKRQREIALQALSKAGAVDIHPSALVRDLSLSRRQMVEIAKALARKPRLLILDEATSALTATDVDKVFAVIRALRNQGTALVYISHRMHEIAELADDCSVFRNGSKIATYAAGTKTDTEVVELMIGREYKNVFPPKPTEVNSAAPLLECSHLSWAGRLKDISLAVRPGEIVGLGGLDGQGQKELLLGLFGVLRGVSGDVSISGEASIISGPDRAKREKAGMALIPEDRKTEGLMLPMTIRENLCFSSLSRISRFGVIDRKQESAMVSEMIKTLSIKVADAELPVSSLSGGNQQKIVIAKWLMNKPRIVLLNDPTRGIDVGTKQEIYVLLRRLADAGVAIIFYSTDYDELIGCCDRVLVMYDGKVVRELQGEHINERTLIASALNLEEARNG